MTAYENDIVCVARGSLSQIQILHDLLRAAGTESRVVGDNLTAGLGTALPGSIELWIHSADAEAAGAALARADGQPRREPESHPIPPHSPPASEPLHEHPSRRLAMAIPHAKSGEVIDLRPEGGAHAPVPTSTLVKTDKMEVIRLAVPAGKELPRHQVPGEITVQCLEGRVGFMAGTTNRELRSGQMLYLAGNEPHSLHGIEDASVLLTILLQQQRGG